MQKKIAYVALVILIMFFIIILIKILFMRYYSFRSSSFQKGYTGMPDPAAVHCSKLGYKYSIKNTPSGQEGICIFPDGSQCEEWSFFRGKCGRKWLHK